MTDNEATVGESRDRPIDSHATVRRRTYLAAVGSTGTLVALGGCLHDDDEETIVPGTASGFPPFEFVEDGQLVGFDIDLAEAVIDEAGYQVGEWVDIEFDSLIPSLEGGDIDLVAAAMTITEDRAEVIDFSDPYWEADQAVLVPENDFEPDSFEDLEGASVGAQAGTTGESIVEEELIDTGIISEGDYRAYDNYTLAVDDLEAEAIDAVVVDSPVADTFAADRGVHVSFVHETGEEFGFGMREDDDRIDDVNDALAQLQDDNTYDEIVSDWFE